MGRNKSEAIFLFFLIMVPLGLAVGSCASHEKNASKNAPGAVVSAPGLTLGSKPTEEYLIQPEDILQITVYEEPDLTARVRVGGNGEINFPLLGRLVVAGLTVGAVQEKITLALGEDYLVNPQAQVFIDTYHARNVFVTGAVTRPGAYPLDSGKRTTLMEAITLAGGFRQDAAMNGTRIIRVQNGKENTIMIKAKDIVQKGDKKKDVEVLPNDVVFVPESIF